MSLKSNSTPQKLALSYSSVVTARTSMDAIRRAFNRILLWLKKAAKISLKLPLVGLFLSLGSIIIRALSCLMKPTLPIWQRAVYMGLLALTLVFSVSVFSGAGLISLALIAVAGSMMRTLIDAMEACSNRPQAKAAKQQYEKALSELEENGLKIEELETTLLHYSLIKQYLTDNSKDNASNTFHLCFKLSQKLHKKLLLLNNAYQAKAHYDACQRRVDVTFASMSFNLANTLLVSMALFITITNPVLSLSLFILTELVEVTAIGFLLSNIYCAFKPTTASIGEQQEKLCKTKPFQTSYNKLSTTLSTIPVNEPSPKSNKQEAEINRPQENDDTVVSDILALLTKQEQVEEERVTARL